MSRFKSLKEMSKKKKIFICLLLIAIAAAIVFVVIKFGFPDADVTKPHALAFEVGADESSQDKFEEAFAFFYANCDDEQSKDSVALRDINLFYLARLSPKGDTLQCDSLLYALGEVQDMNKLNKKIKNLESLKTNLDEAKNDVVDYIDNNVKTYKNSTTNYERISGYFSNFAKKFTNYLKNMKDFTNYLEEIIKTSTNESVYSNQLTQFAAMLNGKKLSLCVDACDKKFIDGESVVINAPHYLPISSSIYSSSMFVQKNDAIKLFVENRNETIENIEDATKYSWLNDWLRVLGSDEEEDFLKTIDESTYSNFKTFVQTYFFVDMEDYPKGV